MPNPPLEFYDLRTKSWFTSSNYNVSVNSKGMTIAKAIAPSGTLTTKILKRSY